MRSEPCPTCGYRPPGPAIDKAREARVMRLRSAGKTLAEIGDVLGISKQRVAQIIERSRARA